MATEGGDHLGVATTRQQPRTGAQSVERALAVLRCFEGAAGDLGVSEIAARTGLSVSTAHRLTRALCAGGLLAQDSRTERYQLGPLLVVLGMQFFALGLLGELIIFTHARDLKDYRVEEVIQYPEAESGAAEARSAGDVHEAQKDEHPAELPPPAVVA